VELFRPKDGAQCRKNLGLPLDKKLLLFGAANVLDMRKGARYLFEAVKILVDNFPVFKDKVEIVVFGKMPKELKEGIKLKIHNFKFVSDVKKLVQLYNAADVFVLPSLQDNLPNTVMEAFACGTPVVAFSTGGVPEMVKHKQNGFLAESKNALNLSTGIYETLFISDLEQMGKNAREKVLKEFNADIIAKQYAELYERVIT
jgi:glycosyltransferase involved in cell wall biosynthesis